VKRISFTERAKKRVKTKSQEIRVLASCALWGATSSPTSSAQTQSARQLGAVNDQAPTAECAG